MIPEGRKFDFASDLFPAMLERGCSSKTAPCRATGATSATSGPTGARRRTCSRGGCAAACAGSGTPPATTSRAGGRRPLRADAAVWVGEGVRIGGNAQVGEGSVLDDAAPSARARRVRGSVLLPRSVLGEHAAAEGAVLCPGARSSRAPGSGRARRSAKAPPSARVRRSARASRVAGGVKVPDGAAVSDHLSAKGGAACAFDDEGMCGEVGVELTPELAVRIGCAVGTLAKGRPVGVATGDARCAKVLGAALIAGVRSTARRCSTSEASSRRSSASRWLQRPDVGGLPLRRGAERDQGALRGGAARHPPGRAGDRAGAFARGVRPRGGGRVRRLRGHERHRGHVPDRAAAAGP